MKKILISFLILLFAQIVQAEILQAGISVEQVPKMLFGTWQVRAQLDQTNAPTIFKPQSVDFWDMSRSNEFIELKNPYNGACAKIAVQAVEDNLIVFSKRVAYDNNKILTDTVTIRLQENNFTGINNLVLETFSLIDNSLIKTQTATYQIKGEKIVGDNIINFSEELIKSLP